MTLDGDSPEAGSGGKGGGDKDSKKQKKEFLIFKTLTRQFNRSNDARC